MQYLITFLEGMISFISPCMLPLLPLYITYFAGGTGRKDTEKKIMEENGYDLPVFFDSKSEGARAYSIMSIPTTVFIYSDGTIMETYMGALNEDSLNKYVDAMLEMETIIPIRSCQRA